MSATDGITPQYTTLDLLGTKKAVSNSMPATAAGDLVEYQQLVDFLNGKQGNVTADAGLNLDGDTLTVALSSSASDYSSVTLTGASTGSLDGVYTRLPYAAYLFYKSGTDGDYDLRHDTGSFSCFYKDNGNGTWDFIGAEDTDGVPNGGNQWSAFTVAINPLSVSGNVTDFVLNSNSGVKFDITSGHDQDDLLRKVPTESSNEIDYGAGASDSFLGFEGGKLKAIVSQDPSQWNSTNLPSGGAVKTYIDEQDVISRAASTNSFSNSVAGLAGSPNNVQTAIEKTVELAEAAQGTANAAVAVNNTQGTHIAAHSAAMGIPSGQADMGEFTTPFITDNQTQTAINEQIGAAFQTVYQSLGTINGLAAFETDFGAGFTNLPNSADAKTIFLDIDSEISNLALGQGVFWQPCDVHEDNNISDLDNPATDTFGGAVATQGERVLLLGQTASSENGIYIFDTSSTPLVRANDADLSDEFAPNKTVQVLRSSEDGISGATFAYTGIDAPTVGTNVLPFQLKSKGVVGDSTITEQKLGSALQTVITEKANVVTETVTLSAGVPANISHPFGKICVAAVYNSATDEKITTLDEANESNSYQLYKAVGGALTVDVVIIGLG